MTDNSLSHAAGGARPALVIDVALTPDQLDSLEQRRHTTCIVVDVIRATTTLCVLFERGCQSVLVAASVAAACAARSELAATGKDMLLAGEVEGLPPPGFDYGNSPAEFVRHDFQQRGVIFATTNGTRAIRACAGSRAILAGALRNAGAVTRAALALTLNASISHAQDEATDESTAASGTVPAASEARVAEDRVAGSDIVIVCSGRGGRPALDDTLCAGYLVRRLADVAAVAGVPTLIRESARIALATFIQAEQSGSLRAALADSNAARSVERIGLLADLDLCATVDATRLVPMVSDHVASPELPNLVRVTAYRE
jgi:2-phosphosulfolactate phosphatase